MQKKTINKVISKKIADWLSSIEDEQLRKDLEKNVMVSGGCITSMFLGEQVNDYDIYLRDVHIAKRVAEYYCKKFTALNPKASHKPFVEMIDSRGISNLSKPVTSDGDFLEFSYELLERVACRVQSKGFCAEVDEDTESGANQYEYFEGNKDNDAAGEYISQECDQVKDVGEKYRPIFLSSNAITLSNKVQIVLRFTGEAESVHKYFDFIHCQCYWTKEERVVVPPEALEAMLTRTLTYNGSKFPLCSIIRAKKFVLRGWTISASEYLKMCLQLQEFDLYDVATLRDQTTGMDVAYFTELLELIEKNKQGLDKDGRINKCYLMELLNRLFGE